MLSQGERDLLNMREQVSCQLAHEAGCSHSRPCQLVEALRGVTYSSYAYPSPNRPRQAPPFSSRNHQPRRLVILPVLPELQEVEELLFAQGVIVSYEALRTWGRQLGQAYANQLRRRRPRPGDKWHLDEMFLTTHGVLLLDSRGLCSHLARESPLIFKAIEKAGL